MLNSEWSVLLESRFPPCDEESSSLGWKSLLESLEAGQVVSGIVFAKAPFGGLGRPRSWLPRPPKDH